MYERLRKYTLIHDVFFFFRSRCPNKPRPQDIAKAIDTLNDICYPDMKRFLVAKHHKGILIIHTNVSLYFLKHSVRKNI